MGRLQVKRIWTVLSCVWLWALASIVTAQDAKSPGAPPRWVGGGPYKVVAADFTGDGIADLAVAYVQSGLVSIQKGDGRGNFTNAGVLVAAEATPAALREVHNIAQGDIDGDGKPDLIAAVGGTPQPN